MLFGSNVDVTQARLLDAHPAWACSDLIFRNVRDNFSSGIAGQIGRKQKSHEEKRSSNNNGEKEQFRHSSFVHTLENER